MAIMPGGNPPRRPVSVETARSLELLERWAAGDDDALQEWIGVDPPKKPAGPWARIVEAAHALSRLAVPWRGPLPPGGHDAPRRGGARYKYPVEGR